MFNLYQYSFSMMKNLFSPHLTLNFNFLYKLFLDALRHLSVDGIKLKPFLFSIRIKYQYKLV